MKKIYVAKSDTAVVVIEKVIKSSEAEVSLYIPRNSLIASSRDNFKLLKREAKSAGKVLTIESVDDDVLELAESFGLNAINAFFGKQRSMTDIILRDADSPRVSVAEPKIKNDVSRAELTIKRTDETKQEPEPEIDYSPSHGILKKVIKIILALAIATGIAAFAVFVLPRAQISLVLAEQNWDFVGSLIVDSKLQIPAFSENEISLPGIVFSETKNVTKLYPASGSQNVKRNAKGIITVYNAFSSLPQSLIKGTRFSTPDGRVFKTDNGITVPGAKIVDNKITPAVIDTPVTAEKPGVSYNIGPTTKFRIPGFQNSPKYNGFYGVSSNPMTGGFEGVLQVPTEDDLKKAKEDIGNVIRAALKTAAVLKFPADIKVLDKASQFSITKEDVNDSASTPGRVSLTAYGEIKVMGFKEQDLLAVLANKLATESKVDLTLKEHSFNYGEPSLDFKKGSMSIPLNFKSTWARPFDPDKFKVSIVGKSASDIKSAVYSIPGLKSGEVKLWPFWVMSAPGDSRKIIVDLDYKL